MKVVQQLVDKSNFYYYQTEFIPNRNAKQEEDDLDTPTLVTQLPDSSTNGSSFLLIGSHQLDPIVKKLEYGYHCIALKTDKTPIFLLLGPVGGTQ